MSKVVRVAWTEHENYHAYLKVPDEWNADDYDLENAMAEWSTEDHDDGVGNREITGVDVVGDLAMARMVAPGEEIEESNDEFWEAYKS